MVKRKSKKHLLKDVSALFEDTWKMYQEKIYLWMGIMSYPLMLAVVSTACLYFLLSRYEYLIYQYFGWFFLGGGILFTLTAIVHLWSQVALLYSVNSRKKSLSVHEAYGESRGMLWSFFLMTLMIGIVTFGAFFVGGSLSLGWIEFWELLAHWQNFSIDSVWAAGIVILGSITLTLIPTALFIVWFSLAHVIFVAEKKTGLNALLQSKEYIRGNFGAVLWRYFGVVALVLLVSMSITFIFGYLLEANDLFESILIDIVTYLFLTPFSYVFSFLLYKSLKDVKGKVQPESTSWLKWVLWLSMIPLVFLLIGGAFFSYLGISALQARDLNRDKDLSVVQNALEEYFEEHQVYPASLDLLLPNHLNVSLDEDDNANYLEDPGSFSTYDYRADPGGGNYELCIDFELKEPQCYSAPQIERNTEIISDETSEEIVEKE